MDELLAPRFAEPTLHVGGEAWRHMTAWTLAAPTEVGGLALVDRTDDGYGLRDAFLLDQFATEIEFELDPDAVSGLLARLAAVPSDLEALRIWWHSHGDEAPFWSGVDEHTIDSFAPTSMISIVLDRRLRTLARLDRFGPRRTEWVWVKVAADEPPTTDDEIAVARQDISRAVEVRPGRMEWRS